MHRRRFLQLSVSAALAPTLVGCFHREPLRMGVHPWIGYEPLYLTEEFGWLPDSVTLSRGFAARDSINGLLSGNLDGAALTIDEAVRVQAAGVPVRAVAVTDVSVGADMLMARPGIHSLEDLAGKSIGVELGSVSAVLLFAALQRAGLTADQVSLVDLPVNRHLQSWQLGQIDVSVCYEPTASRLKQAGAVGLFDSRQVPDTIFDLLVVTREAERRIPGAIEDLVRAHFRGLQHLVRNSHDAIYRVATRQQVDPEAVREALASVMLPELAANRRYLAPGGRVETVARELATVLEREGLIDRVPDVDELCSRDFLPGSLPS
ncbi:ABC transporter substrate-binding protein [Marinobacter oulmenensis]|uniref:NitT/TauT family transport system substrate-binding protein n=1 Tax=Marinobacter oulmenensis TaxID=643747 RepID=A0A840U3C2_9GAMM|nr:ABC transporter substrate-binding protein [Marinobacter oulmenensis]MBB5319639.1 NitT/TauT family transport system substrate-binding protein [Marinobacter oulmenensis]